MNDAASLSAPSVRGRFRSAAAWIKRRHNILLFVSGFLFDMATLNRIDSWLDLGMQLAYLTGLTLLLVGQHRSSAGLWTPGGLLARAWEYNVEVLHFFYGGLLSNYVIFYAKSGSGLRPLVFFGLLVLLMVANEMPQVRRIGHRLRLGLYAFCVASFLIYFVPVLVGRMGDWVFLLSIGLAAVVVWGMAGWLARGVDIERRSRHRQSLAWPALTVLAFLSLLYAFRLVPPVPLSVKFEGVYHQVEKDGGICVLRAEKPQLWLFWRRDDRFFRARPGDAAYYFARVYAPARFQHRIAIHWERLDPATGRFVTRARAPIDLLGGREQGFRAYAHFDDIEPGRWRVGVETEDGRTVGRMRLRVVADGGAAPRRWIETRM